MYPWRVQGLPFALGFAAMLSGCVLVGYDALGEVSRGPDGSLPHEPLTDAETQGPPGSTDGGSHFDPDLPDAGDTLDATPEPEMDATLPADRDAREPSDPEPDAALPPDAGPGDASVIPPLDAATEETCSGTECFLECASEEKSCGFDCGQTKDCAARCTPETSCQLACAASSSCGVTCAHGSSCSLLCSGRPARECSAWCETTSHCQVDCRGAKHCELDCAPGATCEIDCRGAKDCSGIVCKPESSCLVKCDSAESCKVACEGTGLSCANGIRTCNRPCP